MLVTFCRTGILRLRPFNNCSKFRENKITLRMEFKRGVLTEDILSKFKKNFESEPKNILASLACVKSDPYDICCQRKVVETTCHTFSHKVDSEVKPMTNQKNAGTCWIYSCLNVMRIPFAKHHQLEEFEFSPNHILFWEKIERCNYFLHMITEVFKRGEKVDGRLVSFLLHDPITDGGQWHMIVNIINKYGVMPKKCFPSTYSTDSTLRLNAILKAKIREYARDLNLLIQKNASDEELEEKISSYMEEIYRIIRICLSIPPDTFTWEYYNKSKAFCSIGPITPLKFYQEYVKPHYDVDDKVCLVNDPRPENPYNCTYTVDCLNNVVGGVKVVYLNQKSEQLLRCVSDSIQTNEAVWFGCEVAKMIAGKLGIQDLRIIDYKILFDVELYSTMSKADRLVYGDSTMSHAMVFTAVSLDANNKVTKLRVENTWGEDRGEKGYFIMTREWFEEFGFEVVIDKKLLPKEVLETLKLEPKVLPAWDPMGALAS